MSRQLSILTLAIVTTLFVTSVVGSAAGPRPVRTKPSAKPAALADSFAFLYAQGFGTKLDTYQGTVTKDLVNLPDTTVRCVLSRTDVDSVYRKMIEIRFFEMQEPHPAWPYPCLVETEPSTSIHVEATLGSTTRRLSWTTGQYSCMLLAKDGPWIGLRELEALLWRILVRQPEYRRLPSAQGAYY